MKIYCKDKRKQYRANDREGRAINSVSSDIDRLLNPKSYEDLEALENQINHKLDSNEPIDTDYWESLLKSLLVWKAKARLKKIYQTVIESRLTALKTQQATEADALKVELISKALPETRTNGDTSSAVSISVVEQMKYNEAIDPEPMLQLRPEDKSLGSAEDEKSFLGRIVCAHNSSEGMRLTDAGS